ncbi:MYND-type domain-containing protein [Mycena indigotica]|uniref:MYND-type domain-containing protein n=1 Tax=Mycena indigotica TaxID=2126181 RepID=A0A8H6SKI0_9AGAR|nr:MYND-type domain-containing protein [Mycena indigotica]KAF7299500.1 MYND-type domain-containing protein [Mycena indigotica]
MKSLHTAISALILSISLASANPNPVLSGHRRGDEFPFIHVPFAHASDYTSGKVHMSLMNAMTAVVESIRQDIVHSTGIFDPMLGLSAIKEFTPCVDGYAGSQKNNTYMCKNADLHSFTPHRELGSTAQVGNDIWGWAYTDEEGKTREFGLVGQMDGTAFVEVLPTGQIAYLGRLPTQTENSGWRDIKTIGHYAYIGSEADGHGIQVFDLDKLLDPVLLQEPKEFSIETDLTAHYDGLPQGSSHNVVAHADKNLIVAVGAKPRLHDCGAGLIFVDVSDPSKPTTIGCAGEDGYVHDAQCLTYYGPDRNYNGSDICYSFNEDTFTIYDITDVSRPVIISATFYHGVAYAHQGWVFDEKDQSYLFLNDEMDEMFTRGWATDQKTTTYIWDIKDLSAPKLAGHYKSPVRAIDHNLYVHKGLIYESNYKSGLRVVDASMIAEDASGKSFFETAFFDVHPEDDAIGGEAVFGGAWSAYPYFESGHIIVNTLERGLFVVKLTV